MGDGHVRSAKGTPPCWELSTSPSSPRSLLFHYSQQQATIGFPAWVSVLVLGDRQGQAGRAGQGPPFQGPTTLPPPPVDLPAHGKEGTDPSSKDREIKRNQGLLSDFARLSVLTYLDFSDMGEGGRMTGKADSRCPLCQRGGGGSNSIVPPGYGVVVAVVIAVTMRYN